MLEIGGHLNLEKAEAARVLPRAYAELRKHPNDPKILGDIGHCYNVLEREELAFKFLERAANNPNPFAWLNFACILRQCGMHEKAKLYAWNAYRNLPEDKKAGHVYAEELIREGQWLKAWPLCDKYRISKDGVRIPELPEWRGEDIAGKHLLIVCEGGRGDFLWLLRFIPMVTAKGITVSLAALEDIAASFGDHPYLGNANDDAHERPYDYWCSIFELLMWLEIDKPFWPGGPYILADEQAKLRANILQAAAIASGSGPKKIGLCWDCGEAVDVRKFRSLKREQAARLLGIGGITWISLQKGQKAPYPCLEPQLNTWKDTVAAIESLDLVVTVDTAVAHLAGAMGKPTFLVLGGFQDCKWMSGETTGWYPTFRIFRNEGFGFEDVVHKVESALKEFAQ